MQYSLKDFYGIKEFGEKIDIKQDINLEDIKITNKTEKKEEKEIINIKKSKINNPNKSEVGYIRERELELMHQLYSDINRYLYPFVVEILDEFDFIGSPVYSISGIDRETISQMIDRVINTASESLDQVGELKNEITSNYLREWDRWGLLRASIESLLLNDIFAIRRPIYYSTYAPNILR